jgi:methylmalonyl-CoA mutase
VAVQQDLPLASEFPTPSREQWRALVDKVLAGAPFDRRLVTRTYDGLSIQPLYTAEDAPASDAAGVPGLAPFTRGRSAALRVVDGWDVRQHHEGHDAGAVNRAVLADLEGGATSVSLGPVPDLAAALAGVQLDLAPVCLHWGPDARRGADELVALWDARGVPASAALGELGLDPLDTFAAGQATASQAGEALDAAAALAARLTASHPRVRTLRVDATRYAEAGASDAQELAFALATGVAYLRALVAAGLGVDDALAQLSFSLAATPEQFPTMAKLRAARRCWSRVAEASGASGTPAAAQPGEPGGATAGSDSFARLAPGAMFIHARTSLARYSQRDPWVNPLRATIACFAAAVAGADAITVLPMGAASGQWDDDGRRLARNTQIVLLEEAGLARVTDPAGGSYFVDRFTEDLAAEAWRRFQEIESRGGMAVVLADGWAADPVRATWEARRQNLGHRRDPLTGVSEFPNAADRSPAGSGAGSGTGSPVDQPGPFPLRRLAAPFEALRDAADAAPTRPAVFLANLGPQAVHGARAGFARNLFEVAGFQVLDGEGSDDPAEVAAAYRSSGAPLAVICSSDAVYEQVGEDAARALKGAGAPRVYLAGNPGERRPAYESAGVDEFVFVGVDALDVLRRALDAAGVPVGET